MGKTQNYHTIRYGNKDGEIKFGHVHNDDNVAAFIVRSGYESQHYISMEASGPPHRKNGTIHRCTGAFQIKAGDNVTTSDETPNNAVYIEAVNGDIVLNAPHGRIRLIAENVDVTASGPDGKNGVITIDANEKILLNAPIIDLNSKVSTKIFSEKTVELIGNGILNIYGGLVEAMDGATTLKGSKVCPAPVIATKTELLRAVESIQGVLS